MENFNKTPNDYSKELNDEMKEGLSANEQMVDEIPIINLDEQAIRRRVEPAKPWSVARQLSADKKAEFMTPEDIITISKGIVNIRDRALFLILYACACRVEEVVRFNPVQYGKSMARVIKNGRAKNMLFRDYKKKKLLAPKEGMTREHISVRNEGGREILVFKLRNLKVKTNRDKFTKLIPLPLDHEINRKIADPIIMYANTLQPDEELFPFTARRAEQIISKLGFNPHFFRKLRLTHLVKYHNFSDQKLVEFAGWTDSRPAKHYIRIGWKDLIDSM